MAKNDFKAFATDRNANVMPQKEWEALPALLSGFTAGKASSAQVNKVIRQASFIAAALAQYTANKSGLDVLDDGDLNGFITKMSSAFGKDYQALDATLTALAGLATGANKLPYFTGTDKAAQTDLTKVGRDIIGKNTIADILAYLGLGEGSALPVGVPVPWPSATPPTGWLKCNGAAFDKVKYPKLAKVYTTGKLPDLRGEFIRGWDDGRGVDSGRTLLSAQSDTLQNITGSFLDMTAGPNNSAVGVFTSSVLTPNLASLATGGAYKQANYYFDASRVARTSAETRARNIAFNYIVRAA
ncbi:phage tail protein [Escherichia sp. MOD1-EC5350]|uniref:phage tail protein n=1 Tax=Escherichia sp. MOD1-EC5350 TaxID=2093866 RepID=UPI0018E4781A|nr:phage tail protein [Escherichia sp. MOD1-EC5350]HDJ9686742.1 tail fiber protein [Escherichia coli]